MTGQDAVSDNCCYMRWDWTDGCRLAIW